MDQPGTVNSQIVDGVADVVTLTGGGSPSHAFAMLDAVMAETLGMAMYNAVNRQQGSSMIGAAAVTATCAKMLTVPFPILPAPAPPDPPPAVETLAGPPPKPLPPADLIAAATTEAETAIAVLQAEVLTGSADAGVASAKLAAIAASAAAPPADPATPSTVAGSDAASPTAAAPAADPSGQSGQATVAVAIASSDPAPAAQP
ncbi:MAG: RebB family R body protein [Sphingomonas sp.]